MAAADGERPAAARLGALASRCRQDLAALEGVEIIDRHRCAFPTLRQGQQAPRGTDSKGGDASLWVAGQEALRAIFWLVQHNILAAQIGQRALVDILEPLRPAERAKDVPAEAGLPRSSTDHPIQQLEPSRKSGGAHLGCRAAIAARAPALAILSCGR